MIINKSYIAFIIATSMILLMHYMSVVSFSTVNSAQNSDYSVNDNLNMPSAKMITGEVVAHVFGLEFIEQAKTESVENIALKDKVILLDAVEVSIQAISTVANQKIIYISYLMDNSEVVKVKLKEGDTVLGFTLEKANDEELVFINEETIVVYKIFKRTN